MTDSRVTLYKTRLQNGNNVMHVKKSYVHGYDLFSHELSVLCLEERWDYS